MLEIQKYLLEHGEVESFKYFREELALSVKEASDNCRVLFKYDMIDSPMGHPICQEARGLILDRSNNWEVLSWPFRKFFNHGEGHATKIDLYTAAVLEKVDGSCITLYYWNGQWRTQTLGMLDAEGNVNNIFPPATFNELFHRTLGVDITPALNAYYTYTFELATPYNRIVTRYDNNRIVLLSIRDIMTLKEIPYNSNLFIRSHIEMNSLNALLHIEYPKIYPIAVKSLDDVAVMASELPQMDEGYVVVDALFNRVKIKNPSYLAILHLKDSASSSSVKSLIQLALKNEGSEFLSYFPEFKDQYDRICLAIASLKNKLITVWDANKHIEVQKDFALAVIASKIPLNQILFNLRNGKIKTVSEGICGLEPKRVMEELKLDEGSI